MVKMKSIQDLLTETPFFKDMQDSYLQLISGCGEIVHFEEGEFLLKESEQANSFYLILEGEVCVESYTSAGGALIVSKVLPGGVAGYSWLFPPYLNQFDTRALTKVRAIHLDGKCLRQKAESDHELGYQLMKRCTQIILQRMQDTRRQMLDVYGTEKKFATGD